MKRKNILFLLMSLILLSSCGSKDYEIIDTSVSNIKVDDKVVMPFNTVVTLRNFSKYEYNKTFQVLKIGFMNSINYLIDITLIKMKKGILLIT